MIYFDKLVSWLNENAKFVDLENEWQVTYKQEAYTYSSQTNAMGYAIGDVKRRADKLDKLGIPYEIRRFGYNDDFEVVFDTEDFKLQSYHYGKDWDKREKGYCLYAPLAPYQLDAIQRNNSETLLEWAVSCWKSGQNPKVLSPFLPDDIFDKSMKLHMGG